MSKGCLERRLAPLAVLPLAALALYALRPTEEDLPTRQPPTVTRSIEDTLTKPTLAPEQSGAPTARAHASEDYAAGSKIEESSQSTTSFTEPPAGHLTPTANNQPTTTTQTLRYGRDEREHSYQEEIIEKFNRGLYRGVENFSFGYEDARLGLARNMSYRIGRAGELSERLRGLAHPLEDTPEAMLQRNRDMLEDLHDSNALLGTLLYLIIDLESEKTTVLTPQARQWCEDLQGFAAGQARRVTLARLDSDQCDFYAPAIARLPESHRQPFAHIFTYTREQAIGDLQRQAAEGAARGEALPGIPDMIQWLNDLR